MLNLKCEYINSQEKGDFKDVFVDVLSKIEQTAGILKMSVFFESCSDDDYDSKVAWMNGQIREKLCSEIPTPTFVAQKPLQSLLVFEFVTTDEEVQYRSYKDYTYAVLEGGQKKLLFLSGMKGNSKENIREQGSSIFYQIHEILTQEEMTAEAIVRQWNYVPNITGFDENFQHYQQFNDARTIFYNQTEWRNGYPAATGIGTKYGPLLIDVVASFGHHVEFAVMNPKQIDAHVYSDGVLIGKNDESLQQKSTPKFERAKLLADNSDSLVFVSGTAAIIGEESIAEDDAEIQTLLTLENIERLISRENLSAYGNFEVAKVKAMRVYIKRAKDYQIVKKVCQAKYPSVPFIYLLADVCRDELLVEIEALVQV